MTLKDAPSSGRAHSCIERYIIKLLLNAGHGAGLGVQQGTKLNVAAFKEHMAGGRCPVRGEVHEWMHNGQVKGVFEKVEFSLLSVLNVSYLTWPPRLGSWLTGSWALSENSRTSMHQSWGGW